MDKDRRGEDLKIALLVEEQILGLEVAIDDFE